MRWQEKIVSWLVGWLAGWLVGWYSSCIIQERKKKPIILSLLYNAFNEGRLSCLSIMSVCLSVKKFHHEYDWWSCWCGEVFSSLTSEAFISISAPWQVLPSHSSIPPIEGSKGRNPTWMPRMIGEYLGQRLGFCKLRWSHVYYCTAVGRDISRI